VPYEAEFIGSDVFRDDAKDEMFGASLLITRMSVVLSGSRRHHWLRMSF